MKHKLKIAIYSGAVPSTTFIERLIDGLAEKGAEIYLFGIQRKKIVVRNNIHLITYSNKLGKLFILLKYSLLLSLLKSSEKKKLDRIIFKKKQHNWLLKTKYYPVLFHQPDVFHLQWVKGIEDWIWVQEFGIKLIVSLRGAHINYSPITDSNLAEKYQNLFPKTDGFHSVSKAIIEEAIKYKANPAKIQVVYSGLDLDKIKFQLKTFNSSDTLKIISIGRDHWIKGYTYALNCMQILNTEGIKFNYTIVGVGTNEELLYLRSQFGLQNEINFIEKLPFNKVLETVQSADVLLLSSVKEGIANAVLEAMALGTLVISTNCGGMNEVLIDNENGFLIPPRDTNAMASALVKTSKLSLKAYQKITKSARNTVEKQHNYPKMIDEMHDLYSQVLNRKL